MIAISWGSLAWTLLHSLWQAGVVGGLLWLMLRRMPAHWAEGRHTLAVGGLFAVVLGSMVTLAILCYCSSESLAIEGTTAPAARDSNSQPAPPSTAGPSVSPTTPTSSFHAPLIAASTSKKASPRITSPGWEAAVVWLWLVGMLVMLIRMVGALRGASRLVAQADPCKSERVLEMVQSLSQSLGLFRRVAVRVHPHLRVPAVVGLVRPVILLPLAAMNGLSTQQLEAILLHELMHIRRHDLLVQIGQMLIEAMLFFNPAVWWISRQVRIEREACADRAAVSLLGQPDRYVQLLADWAQRLQSQEEAGETAGLTTAGLAFAVPGQEHSLLDRARRLLVPGYQPKIKLPWHTLTGLLLIGALLIGGLWQGSNLAVRTAAKVLSPQERLNAIEQVRQTHGEPAYQKLDPADPANKVTIAGTIRTTDGSPIPKGLQLYAIAYRDRGSTAHFSFGHKGGHFEYARLQPADVYYIYVQDKNYAPAIVGPLKAQPGGRIDDVQIVLSTGSTSTLRIIDPQKRPIAGAAVKHSYPLRVNSASSYLSSAGPQEADANGEIALSHTADLPLQVEVRAAGYQFDRFEINPNSASLHELALRAATPATGTIIDQITGKPLSHAEIRLVRRSGAIPTGNSPYETQYLPLLATTDSQGRFTLDTLRDDASYTLRIDAPDHGPELVYVQAGQTGLTWEMGPPRVLEGRVIAGLDKLELHRGQRSIQYSMSVEVEKSFSYGSGFNAPVRIEKTESGEVGFFKTQNLLRGTLTFDTVTPRVKLDTRSLPGSPLELDLRKPTERANASREVVFRVVVPNKLPPAQGTLRLDYLETPKANGYIPVMNVPLKNGEVRYMVPVPTKVIGRGQNVTGYWVPQGRDVQVPEGNEPFVIELPAIPAGAVYGKVLKPDGSPATRAFITPGIIKQPPVPNDLRASIHDVHVEGPNDQGRFVVSPLPLGGVYGIAASSGEVGNQAYAISEPLQIDDAVPLHEIELRFAQGVSVTGIVVDPTGKPVVGVPVRLHYSTPWSYGFGGADHATNSQGQFRFEHINPDLPGSYELTVCPTKGFQSSVVKLKPSEKQMRIELKPGLRLEGKVINTVTGKPLASARIMASPRGYIPDDPSRDVESLTDTQGHFAFDNLHDREYWLTVDGTWPEGTTTFQKDGQTWYRSPPGKVNHFRPQKEPVEVRMTTQPPSQP